VNEDELVDLLKWQDRARDEPYAGNNTQIMVEIVPDLIAEVRRLQARVDELLDHYDLRRDLAQTGQPLSDWQDGN